MNGDPQPLAVALLDVSGMSLVQQVAARTQMVDAARTEGYSLLEILDVGRDRRRDADVYAAAAALVRRMGAEAVLVHGDVDRRRLQRATAGLPVRVVHSTAPGGPVMPGRPTVQRAASGPSGMPAAPARSPGGRLATLVGTR